MFTKRSFDNSVIGNTTNGGPAMNRIFAIAALFLSLGLAACETQSTLDVNGTLPVSVDPSVTYVGTLCIDDYDCEDLRQMCQLDIRASDSTGYPVFGCITGCNAEFEIVKVENADGTWTQSRVKVANSDTCQRDGDAYYCDMNLDTPACKKGTEPTPPAVDPTTDPVVEPPVEASFMKVSCCFNAAALVNGTYYAQLAWSTSTPENPENFGKDGDLALDANGCFTSTTKVETAKYYRGFWTELTLGKVQSKDENGNVVFGQWLGSGSDNEYAPVTCEVDDVTATLGTNHAANCGFGFFDAVNDDGTSMSCME